MSNFRKRRRKLNNRRKRRLILNASLLLVFFIGMGYSMLGNNLGIFGTLKVNKYVAPTLYNVLKTYAEEGNYAKEYTGEHHDSFTEEPSQKIYHWYANSITDGTAIQDKNNVIFAGHCWQMIRTTDTGGVKMIYNGEAENNQCLNTRGNHVGYAKSTTQSLSTTYYYGTSYEYDKTNNVFSLSGNVTTGTINTGEYTCKSTSSTGTCATLYLVDTLSSGTTYNVLPLNGNSHYSQFGTLQFNQSSNSPIYIGYMYNTVYPEESKSTSTESMLYFAGLEPNYWYANSVTWGSPTTNKYNLNNPYQVSSTDDYPNLVGEYTFRNTSQTYTSTSVYYIAAVNNTTMYYIQLHYSTNHYNLADYNYTYTYGESYTDNGDGTYTINNPTLVERKDWYTNYSNVKNKYVCKNAVNDTCSDLWYTTYTSKLDMNYIKPADSYKYASGFTYDSNTGTYSLNSDSVTFWNISDSTNKTSINTHHYTCWDKIGECTTISYLNYVYGATMYYINITNGKSVEDALNEMFYDDNVNTINSTIKTGVDAWYKQYLSDYLDMLEDTIYCNDRSIKSLNGWDPNGGNVSTEMYFNGSSDLSCPNDTDKFSVSNSKAQLIYKVGLMSYSEMNLLNRNEARTTGKNYWLGSPYNDIPHEYVVGSTGHNSSSATVDQAIGVRPAVSLKPGTEYTSGDGSMNNPFIVE